MKILTAVICAVFFSQGLCAAPLDALRAPILMNFGQFPELYVKFNHTTHKNIPCRLCHHKRYEDGKRFVKCTIDGCHSIPGPHQTDPMSAFMAYHAAPAKRSCYGCHVRERAEHPEFRGCQPCHMIPAAKVAAQEKK